MAIDFNRDITDNCPSFTLEPEVELPKFTAHHLYGKKGQEVFTVDIGQAGSEQGYKALTGLPSWGIAWYINGVLIPELHLERGVSYTFLVGGGTDPSEGSMYHPFYFTDSIKGGYATNSNGTIYPGKVNGKTENYAVGGYCEWKLTSHAIADLDKGSVYNCFETFKADMYLDCTDGSDEYTEFVFTPDSSTPDILYYQCYTHESLGWKVHVYDNLPKKEIAAETCSAPTQTMLSFLLFLATLIFNLLYLHL
ncbi:protein Skeletor, isoforms B/C-like [Watersipora subatra]|uniref:protein Skeletor, isoforms B/C-like n=1 Tax=Watersipora subatra TaxID=2589382 RepID=UPI00355C1C6A